MPEIHRHITEMGLQNKIYRMEKLKNAATFNLLFYL